MSKLRTIGLLVIAILAIAIAAAFAWLNPHSVQLDLGLGVIETPVAYALIASFAVGWLFGLLVALGRIVRLAGRSRREKRAARLAEAEAASLRQLSVADDA